MEIGCVNEEIFPTGGDDREICEYILSSEIELNKIYITGENPDKAVKDYEKLNESSQSHTDETTRTLSYQMYLYLRTLNQELNKDNNFYNYYLVIEYTTIENESFDRNYYYASIPFDVEAP